MPKNFTIIPRKELFRVPKDNPFADPIFVKTYKDKDYSNPLRVFLNHEEGIPDGTIVGVMLEAKDITSWLYQASNSTDVLSSDVKVCTRSEASKIKDENQKLVIVDDKTFRFNAIYEHFFRVQCRSHDNNSFDLEPVFLDGHGVLRKEFNHYFKSSTKVPLEYISDRVFLISQYLKTTPSTEIDLNDSYVSADKVKKFIEAVTKLSLNETATAVRRLIQWIKKNVPFNHHRNIIDPLSGAGTPLSWITAVDLPLFRFYEAFEKHKELLARLVFTQVELEAIGSWQQVNEHAQELYLLALSQLGTEIEIPIEYCVGEAECLVPAVLDVSSLVRISKTSIFRVFLSDSTHCLRPSRQLCSWGGVPLPHSLLNHLQPGNIVRIFYGRSSEPERWGKLYVTLLCYNY